MNEQTTKLLQDLADKLGVSVQYLWAALVKGNRIEGAILFGFVGLGIVLGIVAVIVLRKGFRIAADENARYDEEDPYWLFGGVTAVVSALFTFGLIYWAVMDTFCPEYGALADILSAMHR